MNLHHLGIRVADLDGSIDWYRNMLGYELERRFRIEEAALDIVMLSAPGGGRIELLGRATPSEDPLDRVGEKHICFEVADVGREAERLRSAHATFIQEPKDIPAAGVRNFWITDREGNLVEYIEPM